MAIIGDIVVYIIMAFVVAGAVAAIRDDEHGMGREFKEGLHAIGPIFIPVAGIMASIPYLSRFIEAVVGPVFGLVGASPAMAATTVIAVDMGGYQLAEATASNTANWIMAAIVGYMAGATIVFSIPVGLAMLDQRDHKYMALGIMSGILTVPIGVLITTGILSITDARVRDEVSTTADSTYALTDLGFGTIFANLVPLVIIVVAIALGLYFYANMMIRGFMWFGKAMDTGIKLVLAFSIVEYFTGFFSTLFGSWGFDPIIADAEDQFRALEIAGYIGITLAGAFPMVYVIRTYLARPLGVIGQRFGISAEGSAGILAAAANILALYHLIKTIPPKDKVLCIAFAVCSAFLLGDHLAFTANFQPNMILPLMLGKFGAGLIAIALAYWIAVPTARELEQRDRDEGVIGENEYVTVEGLGAGERENVEELGTGGRAE
ncbi:MAG TPA: ethanolamine utilization protein EutH [Rubrobacteraceae bacterium]|nr:ethanolamine utilization protein EutH [Rubrobacteraceae bacterium]